MKPCRLLLVAAFLLSAAACVRVSSGPDGASVSVSGPGVSVSVSADGEQASAEVEAPGASVSIGSGAAAAPGELGLPVFPAATPVAGVVARGGTERGGVQALAAGASFDEVVAWYDERLTTALGWRIRKHVTPQRREAEYQLEADGARSQVRVEDDGSSVLIALSREPLNGD